MGITFVIVTHDQEEAMTVSRSRIAVMDQGPHRAGGSTPAEIYEYRQCSRYVADFIGDVNIFRGACHVTGNAK